MTSRGWGAVVLCLVVVGPAAVVAQEPLPHRSLAEPEPYLMQPGDVLELRFFYNPELNATVPVRPDGKISAVLVNEVTAAGRTPIDLRKELVERYAATLKQPELTVIVKEFAARRIYIGGEVNQPRLLTVPGRVSLVQAIFEAGGLKRSGKASDIVVLRYQGTPQPLFMKVDLTKVLERGETGADVPLQALDIVWVPKTKIAKANDFIDQYIRQLVPIPMSLGITYIFNGWWIQ